MSEREALAGVPSNYSLHPLRGSALPDWPVRGGIKIGCVVEYIQVVAFFVLLRVQQSFASSEPEGQHGEGSRFCVTRKETRSGRYGANGGQGGAGEGSSVRPGSGK